MEKTLQVLNGMVEDGVIKQYAIGGAIAAIFYIEPINTNDLDIFFSATSSTPDLAILEPLYDYLSTLGYKPQGETVDIEGWPVQFLPIFNPLIEEAVDNARETNYSGITTRVMTAEHLVAIMLQTGRLKDHARVEEFLEQEAVDRDSLEQILARHDLLPKWDAFKGNL